MDIELLHFLHEAVTTLPTPGTESALYYALQIFIFFILFHVLRTILILLTNKQLAWESNPYISKEIRERRILILGDSTAVGTGATSPEDTVGGRFAHDFPQSQIVNFGKNGSSMLDLNRQIRLAKEHSGSFDMIIISSGGNDSWRFNSLKKLQKNLKSALTEALEISGHRVIFLINNNVGFSPFPAVIGTLLNWRSAHVQDIIRKTCIPLKIPTVDLFTEEYDNPFLKNPEALLASDGIHPSSKGYGVWYNRIWRTMVENGFTYADKTE